MTDQLELKASPLRLAPERPPRRARLVALRLGRDLLQLEVLHRRERLARRALVGIAEGAAEGLHAFGHRTQEFALPIGERHAGALRLAPRPLQGAERGAL